MEAAPAGQKAANPHAKKNIERPRSGNAGPRAFLFEFLPCGLCAFAVNSSVKREMGFEPLPRGRPHSAWEADVLPPIKEAGDGIRTHDIQLGKLTFCP